MKIDSKDIDFIIKAHDILQIPSHFPDGEKVLDVYIRTFQSEYEAKKKPYFRSLSPNCMTCIRHCAFTLYNALKEVGIVPQKNKEPKKD